MITLQKFDTDRLSKNSDGQLVYNQENAVVTCTTCIPGPWSRFKDRSDLNGKSFDWRETCQTCKGKGKIKGTRKYRGKDQIITKRCPDCKGDGWFAVEPHNIRPCDHCGGTHKLSDKRHINICNWPTQNDRKLLAELIDFDNFESGPQSFNDEYIGWGICGGVTDYGAYLNLTEEQFRAEVIDNFLKRGDQYTTFMRNGVVCNRIRIKKSRSGYTLYPCY